MAPIILRIKGTKLFSPFDDINSANDLSVIWRVCTKVKDSLENGSRLENLSWRLWHLQQMLEVQGKGNRLRHLIPATQKRFESNDKRHGFKQPKPLKIKVRISKQNDFNNSQNPSHPDPSNVPLQNNHDLPSHLNNPSPNSTTPNSPNILSNSNPQNLNSSIPHSPHKPPNTSSPQRNSHYTSSLNYSHPHNPPIIPPNNITSTYNIPSNNILSNINSDISNSNNITSSSSTTNNNNNIISQTTNFPNNNNNLPPNTNNSSIPPNNINPEFNPALPRNSSSLLLPSNIPASNNIPALNSNYPFNHKSNPKSSLDNNNNSFKHPSENKHNARTNAVQASEFMSIGPSSFLSSGLAPGQSQIEITLDDIFPNDQSNMWDQPDLHHYNPFIPNVDDVYRNSVSNMWGGGPISTSNSINNSLNLNFDKDSDFYDFDPPNSSSSNTNNHKNNNYPRKPFDSPKNSSFQNFSVSNSDNSDNNIIQNFNVSNSDDLDNSILHSHLNTNSTYPNININPNNTSSSFLNSQSIDHQIKINDSDLAPLANRSDGPTCANCNTNKTPLWRRCGPDMLLCNACGLYYRLHNKHRSKTHKNQNNKKDTTFPDTNDQLSVCSNCKTTKTPLWRRDEEGNPLCNACGLYYKLHKEKRPISLKTDIIKKRHRAENNLPQLNVKKPDRKNVPLSLSSSNKSSPEKSSITPSSSINIPAFDSPFANDKPLISPKPILSNSITSLSTANTSLSLAKNSTSLDKKQISINSSTSHYPDIISASDNSLNKRFSLDSSHNLTNSSENRFSNSFSIPSSHQLNDQSANSQKLFFPNTTNHTVAPAFSYDTDSKFSSTRSSFSISESPITSSFNNDFKRNISTSDFNTFNFDRNVNSHIAQNKPHFDNQTNNLLFAGFNNNNGHYNQNTFHIGNIGIDDGKNVPVDAGGYDYESSHIGSTGYENETVQIVYDRESSNNISDYSVPPPLLDEFSQANDTTLSNNNNNNNSNDANPLSSAVTHNPFSDFNGEPNSLPNQIAKKTAKNLNSSKSASKSSLKLKPAAANTSVSAQPHNHVANRTNEQVSQTNHMYTSTSTAQFHATNNIHPQHQPQHKKTRTKSKNPKSKLTTI
ncbi:Transcription factor elt-1 [Smittium culicis]|uniref:Transcription factor elt-1 n=1 Tax=Smittium culicis TaxID=133412 RepID=A0A1R1YT32_9FUNG|nr:Transcription factor elt-1 [Smittium culicis]